MRIMKKKLINKGFTLVELMIVVLLTGIISIGLFSAYQAQSTSYVLQEDVAEMQQRVRAGMNMMIMELREAGYDPNITGDPGISAADAVSITFTLVADDDEKDNDSDGTTNEPNEEKTIIYSFDDTDTPADGVLDSITRKADAGNPTTLIEDVEVVELLFFDEDGNPLAIPAAPGVYTATELDSIRALSISTLVRAAKPDPKLTQNRTYTLASGTVTPAYTDQFRRRLLITNVQFRNLGLIFN